MGTLTDARVIQNRAIGLAFQADATSIASTPQFFVWAEQGETQPGSVHIDPQGTHGSVQKRKEGIVETHKIPVSEFLIKGTRAAALPFLRSALQGVPTSLKASSDFTEAGDSGTDVDFVSFTGIQPGLNATLNSTGKPQVWVKLINTGSAYTVNVYKDSGLSSLVAAATAIAGQSTGNVLTEQNNSKLTAVVDVDTGSTNSGITVAFSTVRPKIGKQITEFMTLFDDDGVKLWKPYGGTVESLEFQSSESEELRMVVRMVFQFWTAPATGGVLTSILADTELQPYSMRDLELTRDPGGTPESAKYSDFTLTITHEEIVPFVGNNPTPDLVKDGFTNVDFTLEAEKWGDEIQTLFENALNVTFQKMRADFTRTSKTLRFDMENPQIKFEAVPGPAGGQIGPATITGAARFDGITDMLVCSVGF